MPSEYAPINWLEKAADWGWYAFFSVGAAAVSWIFYTERRIAGLRLHVSENYVKKTDLASLKADIAEEFKEIKESQGQILDILLQQKIGTSRRRR